jgi:4-amino-4-deoxy-L-arabinose transferase-like glycosyltransferase
MTYDSAAEQGTKSLHNVPSRSRLVAFILIVAVWSVLYLPHLRTSPPWYGDETLTLMIGKSLFAGEGADRSVYATFWHPSYSYQPGYAWIAGLASSLTGGDILGARLFNALLALAIGSTLFFGGRAIFGFRAALFGALIFLTYGQSIIHFRWIYPHNAVALGLTVTCLCLLHRSSRKSDWGAGAGLAMAAASHPLFVHGAIAAWACRIKRPAAWIRMALLPAVTVAILIGWTLQRQSPNVWVFDDIRTLADFYRSFSRENGSGFQTFQNIRTFYLHDFFHAGAAIAALICCNRRFYVITLFLAIVSGLLLQNRQNLTVFYYQAVVFLPVLALAWAGAERTLETLARKRFGNRAWIKWIPLAAFAIPSIFFIQNLAPVLQGKLLPRNFPWVTQNVAEVETAAMWINDHSSPDDLVICHQNIGWLLKCRTADLMQVTAWSGRPTFTFENPPDHARFRFPADIHAAKFLVFGDIDQRWTLGQPNVSWILEEVSNLRWPIVWRGGHYIVVANPAFKIENQ